ncbi:MAG: phosphatase PAP2 family protein [Solirubrobacterales bacterium]
MTAGTLARLDRRVTRAIRTLPHAPILDATLSGLSRATDHANGWLVLGAAGATLDASRRARWLQATAGVAATEATCRAIKRRVGRRRPQLDGLPALAYVPDPLSFPSSHTADAVAAITAFDGLLPAAALCLLAIVQAASRPYLGVHYAGDVAAGVAVGIAVGRLRGPAGRAMTAAVATAHLTGRARSRPGGVSPGSQRS